MDDLKKLTEPLIVYAKNVPQQDFRAIPWHFHMDGRESGLGVYYSAHWVFPRDPSHPAPPEVPGVRRVGHPPHMHKENEVIMLIGTDPKNPSDLGGTVEMCIGEDMVKYTFTESVTICIPANTPHGFYTVKEVHRPFLFVSTQETKCRTEKFMWNTLTRAELDSIEHPEKWVDVGYDD